MTARSVPVAAVYQVLDANTNRAREGLRVVEEVFRFVRRDPSSTRKLKAMRRQIEDIIASSRMKASLLCASRDSQKDPGRRIHTVSEMTRSSIGDIVIANMHRVGEALRVLEEFSKLLDTKASGKFKELRFRLYDLEKSLQRAAP